MTVSVSVFGAAHTVTGSCLMFTTSQARLLVDCGMFQGSKTLKALNYDRFPFAADTLGAVLLTHAHIDHSGLVPKLIGAGFTGPVYATPGTRDLCSVMLPDSGHIQEIEVQILNRRNRRHGKGDVTPIYTRQDAVDAMRAFRGIEYEAWFEPLPGVRARFWNAGHILGSASVELEFAHEGASGKPLRVLVSGDLGPRDKVLEEPAEAPSGFDYVFSESTYGDTERPLISLAKRQARLAAHINAAVNPSAPLLMPAFAVERTQELLVDLVQLMERGTIPSAPVFIDSPLAIRATEIFVRHARDLDPEIDAARLLRSPQLRFTQTEEESRAIARTDGFKIVMAGSGMCDAGRIRDHLKRWLWHQEATVLLTGFQARGTLGRILRDGAGSVRIQGDEITVRARIRWTDDYSGHADCPTLAAWIDARQPVTGGIFLTHGEDPAIDGLAARLGGGRVVRPLLDDVYDLAPGGPRPHTGQPARRLAPEAVSRMDWHNDRSRLMLDISARLDAAADNAARAALIERLRQALEAGGTMGGQVVRG